MLEKCLVETVVELLGFGFGVGLWSVASWASARETGSAEAWESSHASWHA
jgi:uncharacterized BrkB/YihY/UPF0761 family membrane protein